LLQSNDLFVDTDFDEPIGSIDLAIESCQYYKKSYQNRKNALPSYFNDREVNCLLIILIENIDFC